MKAWIFFSPCIAYPTPCRLCDSLHFLPHCCKRYIDIKSWNFITDIPIEPNGEWHFHWKQFSDNQEIASLSTENQASIINNTASP
ncbi:hypothetical protein [Aneurinibacillus migulanus]|uniref:hypothetical protein n=1 Tax=Aneurinibacillus migulanus TaxID=47500 RepID=UPI001269CABC|nr:hypothetical protein [Aneurinibacillus migulanus]